MMTSSPDVPSNRLDLSNVTDGRDGLVASALTWIQRKVCGLHGHDSLLQYQRSRIFLRCTSCGYETPGWDLSRVARPRPSGGDALAVPAPELAVARKIA